MNISTLKRVALALAVGGALSGCAVYGPPYAGYDAPYYPSYGYGPTYVGPPVSLDFSYHEYDRGGRGWYGHHGRRWH